MIIIDGRTGSKDLAPLIQKRSVPVQVAPLDFGDACFEGWGPKGRILVGIERKRLHDMLACIDDARYTGHQRIGMAQLYQTNFLLIEGVWRPHDPDSTLMESVNGGGWFPCRYRASRVMYHKLRRYLFSISLSGVHVLYTRDAAHTAQDIVEAFHYFQKPWKDHTSLLAMQKLAIPTLQRKPTLVRQWAAALEDIGVTLSERAEREFKTPLALATATETDWMRLPGIGAKTARSIVRAIWGMK